MVGVGDTSVVACPACRRKNRVPTVAMGTPRCASCHRPLPWVVHAGTDDFAAVTQAPVPVLVDLWAPWCGPCRTISPLIEQAARDRAGRLKVVKVNVDLAPDVSQAFGVQGIPTLLMLRDGQEVSRKVGALPGHALQSWIEEVLSSART